MGEFDATVEDDQNQADRSDWIVRKGRLGDPSLDTGLTGTTPLDRLLMVWPLTVQAWAFRGIDVDTLRLPRHLMVITRRKR